MPQLISDWMCIATSGTSVDGRPIEEQWLIESAETYSRETYTCLLWPYHEENIAYRQYTCNLGEVDALKYERVGDKVKLYARLIPNQFLIEANQLGQKLFTSVEIMPDFTGTGKNYLIGLVVTDIPASLGTEKLSFSIDGETKEGARGNIEAFTLGNLNKREDTEMNNKPSLFTRLFTARKNHSQQPENNPPESGEDAAKMEELKALIEALAQRLEALEAKATGDTADTPEAAAEDIAEIAEEIAEAADEVAEIAAEVAENPEDEVKAEEFTAAKSALVMAIKKFTPQKPAKRSRRQSRQKGTKATNDYAVLKGQLDEVMKKFSMLDGRQTPLPSGAPNPGNQPFDFT